jgi:hypothetical protein
MEVVLSDSIAIFLGALRVDGFTIEREDYSVKLDISHLTTDEFVTLLNLSFSLPGKDFNELKLPKFSLLSSVNRQAPD